MRNICQRDIFFYMNEELRIPQKVMCSIFNKVRQGNMVETRISEIKQGKRRGYRGLKEAALPCFLECFQESAEEEAFQKLLNFIHREELYFPDAERKEDDSFQSYALRFLECGLANCEVPGKEALLQAGSESDEKAGESGESLAVFGGEEGTLLYREVHSADFSSAESLLEKLRRNWKYLLFVAFCFTTVFLSFSFFSTNGISLFLDLLHLSPGIFIPLTLFLALSPLPFGILDVGITLYSYKKRNPEADISLREIYYIGKYGDKTRVLPGKGRYDLCPSLIVYSIGCNLIGSLSAIAIFLFLRTMPDFSDYALRGKFTSMANIALAFNMLTTFAHTFFLFTREPMTKFREKEENPDTKRADRLHVISNNLYMIYSMSFSAIGMILAFLYSYDFAQSEKLSLSPFFAFAIFAVHAYLWFSSCSPYAVEFNAECAGSFLFLSPIVVIISSLSTFLCFQTGIGSIMVNLANFLAVVTWLQCFLKNGAEKSILPFIRLHRAYFVLYILLFFLFYLLSIHL